MRPKFHQLIFLLLIIAFSAYAIRFIQRTSFVIQGERYYVLFDDGMISMQYAKNLAHGNGPVWNPGERVEGFTNPGWVLYMAIFHLFPIPAPKISLAIQISAVVFLLANLFVVRSIAKQITDNNWLALLAVFITAFFFSLNLWSILGMEVSILTLITSLVAWMTLRTLKTEQFNRWLYILLGASTLIRMDMTVAALAVTACLILFDAPNRRNHLRWGLGTLFIFLAGQTLLRYTYYGEWLPNTYYLKVYGIPLLSRLQTGFGALRQFIWTTNWTLFVIPLLIFLLKPGIDTFTLLVIILGQMAYSVYVGGDAWEHRGGANRFIAIAMPLFFVLLVYGLELIRQAFLHFIRHPNQAIEIVTQASLAFFVLFSLFSFNTILTNDPVDKWLLTKRPIFVDGSERATYIALALKSITTPDAKVAVVSAGIPIYFSDRLGIDLYGKMDKVIARVKPRSPKGLADYADIRPGHAKWDYAYSIGQLQPDVIAQLVNETLEEAGPYLENYTRVEVNGIPFYVRNDSPQILWDEIDAPK